VVGLHTRNSAGLSFFCVPHLVVMFEVQWNNIFTVRYNRELILFGDAVYFGFTHHGSAVYNLITVKTNNLSFIRY
jgi:aspartate/tyrosine/aromatic aminotransferase